MAEDGGDGLDIGALRDCPCRKAVRSPIPSGTSGYALYDGDEEIEEGSRFDNKNGKTLTWRKPFTIAISSTHGDYKAIVAGSFDTTTADGDEFSLADYPDADYFLSFIVVRDAEGHEITVSENAFTRPASNVTVEATFLLEHDVRVRIEGAGGTTASPGSCVKGTIVTLTVEPNEGYVFKEWQVVSRGVTVADKASRDTTFVMPDNDVEVNAVFVRESEIKIEVVSEDGAPKTEATNMGKVADSALTDEEKDIVRGVAMPACGLEYEG